MLLLAGSLAGMFAASFLALTRAPLALITVPLVGACAAGSWYAQRRVRPKTTKSVLAPLAVILVGVLCAAGSESLWLSAFGETHRGCVVTSVHTETPRRSPSYQYNELNCGSSKVDHYRDARSGYKQVGERVDLVLDRTGFAGYAEPGTVSSLRSSLVGVAVVISIAFVLLTLRLPRRAPQRPTRKPSKPQVDRDFL